MRRGSTAISPTTPASSADLEREARVAASSDPPHHRVAEQAVRPDQQDDEQDERARVGSRSSADEVDVAADQVEDARRARGRRRRRRRDCRSRRAPPPRRRRSGSISIMFGSRKTVGAAIIPAIAPSTAASPQPSASIQPTRTPTSRLAVGLIADARIARPSVVKLKNAQSAPTVARQTHEACRCPGIEITTPPMLDGRSGTGCRTASPLRPRSSRRAPLSVISRPIVTITITSTGFCSTGRMTMRSIASAADERDPERERERGPVRRGRGSSAPTRCTS